MNRIYLNNDWEFTFDINSPDFSEVRIPHTVKELPFNYFSEEEYQTVSEYRLTMDIPDQWEGLRLILNFEGVAHYAKVMLNGEFIGEHFGGYTAFKFDISDKVKFGEENLLSVIVDSRENLNIPPFGNVIDYMTFGGIYRDVYLEVGNKTYISDVFARAGMSGELSCDVKIDGEITDDMKINQSIIIDGSEKLLSSVDAKENITLNSAVIGIKPWDIENPNIYQLKTELVSDGEILDTHIVKIGFRDAKFRQDGFYLNGKKLKLRGLDRHQSYPYVGYAMPKSMQEMDAEVMKYELGLNVVRTSHYPQSHHFINRCDEIGLLVVTEMPGWQYIGDAEWKDRAVESVSEMVLQYRNHPSIILWGVRINESPDDDAFYTRTNAVAHELDPSRQTGGIRNFRNSSFIEDVYTYNDFIHDGRRPGCEPKSAITPDMSKPYLITEYCGHMYPTKSFDCEEHRLEQAMRHARVLNAVASHSDISGSCGWCMADYNTHKDFGSGDRICYHGVTDMFRNPKLAAAVYASQGDAVVLDISSSFDIGEHPACIKGDIWAFTNADSLKMYKNGVFIKEYSPTQKKAFSHLKYSPILIDDFVGDAIAKEEGFDERKAKVTTEIVNYIARHGYGRLPINILVKAAECIIIHGMKMKDIVDLYTKHGGDWGGTSTVYRFDAIKDGEVVKTVTKAPMTKANLKLSVYDDELIDAESYDVASIRISAVDENENLLNYSNEPIKISVEGPLEIIGSDTVSLRGGMTGIYLKTLGISGEAMVTLSSPCLGKATVRFKIFASDN